MDLRACWTSGGERGNRGNRGALALLLALSIAGPSLSCTSKSDAATQVDAGDGSVDTGPTCGPGASIPSYVRGGGDSVALPSAFLFGAASAGMQIERGLIHADWYQWANLPGKVEHDDKPDDGPDAFTHFDDDVLALQQAGANSYRFSIEWSRIFPTKKSFDDNTPDPDALAAYHALLGKLKAAGIRPFVTLHHFATPDYFDDITQPAQPQTFERPEFQVAFAEWARRMGKEFGGEVDDWITINEHLILLLGSYAVRKHPPGALLDLDRLFRAAKQLLHVHAAAYDALHEADVIDAGTGTKANVSMAAHNRVFYPRDACEEGDVAAAAHTDYIWNQWTYNALVFGDFDDDLDGKYDGPNDKRGDPSLKGKVDWLGLNYYGNTVISAELKLPYIGGLPTFEGMPTDLPKTDMNWDIFPQGFRPVLQELAKYKLPIYITENGIGDQQDKNKARYLAEHLWEVGRSIAEDGVDVRGYFFWSLTDNFEWDHGYCPRFGLFRVDYTTPSRTRAPTAAVAVYHRIATEKKVTAEAIDALPGYSPPVLCGAP